MPIGLRGKVSTTDLELLIFLYQAPRSSQDICKLLQVEVHGGGPYIQRLREKSLVTSDRDGVMAIYSLTEEGEWLVENLRNNIERKAV